MNKVKAIGIAIVGYTVFPILNAIGVLLDCKWKEFFGDVNEVVRYYWRGEDKN